MLRDTKSLALIEGTLDFPNQEFQNLLSQTIQLVQEQFDKLPAQKAYHHHVQKEVASWFEEDLPAYGMAAEDMLEIVKAKVLDKATGNLGPHMYAYVMAGGTQISILAEILAATINQNVGKWHLGPSVNEIEKLVVQWGADMVGYGKEIGGVLVSGGSAANLAGLTIARNIFFENEGVRQKGLFGMPPFTVYASGEVHGCVDKSLELLGIGTDQLRKISTNSDFGISIPELEQSIEKDIQNGLRPFCIIGTAGTVNTGAIDDLAACAALAKKYDMWFHVDGAYGGLAAGLPSIAKKYKGMDQADSLAIDFHKWLYQPFEAGCVMVKDWAILKAAYFKKADYLDTSLEVDSGRLDFNEHYFQLSRNAKALKIWMSVKTYGWHLLRDMIQKDIDLTHYLADRVEEAKDFELAARSDLAIACFRYTNGIKEEEKIAAMNKALIPALEADGRVFITGTKLKDQFVLRACLINHRKTKETTDYLLEVIREVGQKLDL